MFKKAPLWLRGMLVATLVIMVFPVALLMSSFFNNSYGLSIQRDDAFEFSWVDTNGNSAQFSEIQADAVYLMLGFFSCSDVCPLRVHQLQQLSQRLDLESEPRNVRFLMITIDPLNEPAELRARYFSQLSERFISAEVSNDTLQRLQRRLGERVSSNGVSIAHAGNLYLFNGEQELVRIYSQLTHPKGALYSDLTTSISIKKALL